MSAWSKKLISHKVIFIQLFLGLLGMNASADESADPYRDLVKQIRTQAVFAIPSPQGNTNFSYRFSWGEGKYPQAVYKDWPTQPGSQYFFRTFYDKLFLGSESEMELAGTQIPLACIHVSGQDNRNAGPIASGPLKPELVLKVYLVANDFSCTGPLNPSYPGGSSRPESWDTYIYFEVRDPTIMLPTDIKLRYRWNEYHAILVGDNP